MIEARGGQREEPDECDRPEEARHPRRAMRLHQEQREQDQDGKRHDIASERRRHHFEAFDGRQHRKRGRDHGVAIKQRGADHAEHDDQRALAAKRAVGKRHQCQSAAFAVIVGAQQDDHVFDGDDKDQCPDDERENAEDRAFARRRIGTHRGKHRLAQRIKRARADVAIDDADRAERKRPEAWVHDSFGLGAVRCTDGGPVRHGSCGEGCWAFATRGRAIGASPPLVHASLERGANSRSSTP